jgi:hypothetical protein
MKTVPLEGTMQSVTFFEDDTIETVRQTIALAVTSHPDRLFLEVKATLPRDYYSSNPSHWTDLFFRLAADRETIPAAMVTVYTTQIRPGAAMAARDITRSQWEERGEELAPLYDPAEAFGEWRILGVESSKSFCLPLPPSTEMAALRASARPSPQTQSLFETLHPYPVTSIRATALPEGASPALRINYFPRFRPEVTPPTIESQRDSLESARSRLQRLLELDIPMHETVSIVRAKWYIPLVSTRIPAPRSRFEQMFYGMTVSPTTPYVGYFTAKTETTRHKFYVTDPATKTPRIDIPAWKTWTTHTQPQRRRPTLLLYRGKSRTSFDRIAVTDKDVTIDIRREKGSTETLERMGKEALEWMQSLDALMPFLVPSDLDPSRWELADLSIVATYAKEIREFDMRRMPCLQGLFSVQGDSFRLLRADHASDEISTQELQALTILTQDDVERSPATLSEDMGISIAEATELFGRIADRMDDLNLEKTLKDYPSIKFSPKEVILKFATNLDRTLRYVALLRHVLTSDAEAVEAVCPKRMETVQAQVAVPQQEVQVGEEFDADDDFNAFLGYGAEPEEGPPEDEPGAGAAAAPAAPAAPERSSKVRKVKLDGRQTGTYNYFNNRLQAFDPETFDKAIFPSKCDKLRQPVVLTAEDTARLGESYNFSSVPELERMTVEAPSGTVICPPYWCMRDEAPLREDQLVPDAAGELRCPLCKGKVRTAEALDATEYPVIKRDAIAKYPDVIKQISSINKRKIPCCFQTPRAASQVLTLKEDASYILDATSASLPSLRMAYLTPDLAERLGVDLTYARSVKKGHLVSGEDAVFRVGVGRPSKTLPTLLNDTTPIQRPRDAQTNLFRCSFFRRWSGRGPGDTEIAKIVSSIDQAYQAGELPFFDELEYVTSFLLCEVIRVDMQTGQVICGFWSDAVGPASRTIVLLDTAILAHVSRTQGVKPYKRVFTADLRKPMFTRTRALLRESHARACSTNAPLLQDALDELRAKGKAEYQLIMDPFQRIQAVFVPGEILLPVQPAVGEPYRGVPTRTGYADIRDDELPTGAAVRAFVSDVRNPLFALQGPVANQAGRVVELELASGFRVPIQPEDGVAPVRDIVQTIRARDEASLVSGPPNPADLATASAISYTSEIYEFLLFSLSKDVQTDDYASLRTAIRDRSPKLAKEIDAWFKSEAYEDSTRSPVEFVNKVRTPCGQFRDKASCNSSTLCGWKTVKGTGVCKVRVKPIVNKTDVLRRIVTTLRENDKQRALVLDGRISPFFSTILYLELPHELITTTI